MKQHVAKSFFLLSFFFTGCVTELHFPTEESIVRGNWSGQVKAIAAIQSVALNTDGSRLAVGTSDLKLFNATTGALERRIDNLSPSQIRWSADGNTITVIDAQAKVAKFLNASTGATVRTRALVDIQAFELNPDGTRVAQFGTNAQNGFVRISSLEAAPAGPSFTIPLEDPGTERAIAWSGDGSRIALRAAKGKGLWVSEWNALTGALVRKVSLAQLPDSLALSPDGKLAALVTDGLKILDWSTGQQRNLGATTGNNPVFSADGASVYLLNDKKLEVWSLASGEFRTVALTNSNLTGGLLAVRGNQVAGLAALNQDSN